MTLSDFDRVNGFESNFARAQASDVIELPFGFAVLQDQFPLSHYHNRIIVTSPVSAEDVLAVAEDVLGGVSLKHRYVSGEERLVDSLSSGLVAAGYEREVIATMLNAGPEPERGSTQVTTVSFDEVRPAIIRDWKAALPDATDEELRQLADRTELYTLGAGLTRLAVVADGTIAARVDLHVDHDGHIVQFEHLETHADFRGRGYAQALLSEALWRGRQLGSQLFFLTADLEDWPHAWYRRRGFAEIGRTVHFSRRE